MSQLTDCFSQYEQELLEKGKSKFLSLCLQDFEYLESAFRDPSPPHPVSTGFMEAFQRSVQNNKDGLPGFFNELAATANNQAIPSQECSSCSWQEWQQERRTAIHSSVLYRLRFSADEGCRTCFVLFNGLSGFCRVMFKKRCSKGSVYLILGMALGCVTICIDEITAWFPKVSLRSPGYAAGHPPVEVVFYPIGELILFQIL
ncbi:hypothetical protein QBC38DRAFT_254353 [Podospora fimiseda]|uniref:Uncharacterized protein n=1 Tax=Podospora fimiseda TaxID=252190 RepID=A0AAN7BLH3_9PEZI|nr:hypothetical protein QBC38DRAFT_254353 [Podospora fimiseda]